MPKRRMLLVDDDALFVERLGQAMRARGYEVGMARDFDEALQMARTLHPDRAVIDLRMPGRSGLELVEALVDQHPDIQALILTGYGSIATAVDAVRLGAVGLLQKPVHTDGILAAFERAEAPPLHPPHPDYVAPSLAQVEWDHIQRVLSDCGGNITKAARMLGMHRRTLQRKLQQRPPKGPG